LDWQTLRREQQLCRFHPCFNVEQGPNEGTIFLAIRKGQSEVLNTSEVHLVVVKEIQSDTIQSEEYDLLLLKEADEKVREERRLT